MRVVVTGGAGHLGSTVVTALREAGHEAVSASRRSGVDIRTGAGLSAVLAGAEAVVHTADTLRPWEFTAVTLGGTRTVAEAAAALPKPPHLVYISIVGVDRNPYAYYRAKYAAEQAIADVGGPATIVRATQFHSLAAMMARGLTVGPIGFSLRGMQIQPIDIAWVGRRLAEVATGSPPSGFTRHADLAGPVRYDMPQLSELIAAHRGRKAPRLVGLPALGKTAGAFAAGAILPGPEAELGGETFEEWLAAQPAKLPSR